MNKLHKTLLMGLACLSITGVVGCGGGQSADSGAPASDGQPAPTPGGAPIKKTEAPPAAPLKDTGPATLTALGAPRKDPFYYDWRQLPPPPNVFDSVEPIRVASADVEAPPTKPVEVREAPSRRFAGFMSGEGVFAILEGNGDSEIVQPGGQTSDGYKVVAITTDTVVLRKQLGNTILTQVVAYGDAPANTTARTANNFGGGGFPGAGGGGFPGAGGGGLSGGKRGGGAFGGGGGKGSE